MTAKSLLVAVLALLPLASAEAAKPPSGEVANVTGYSAYRQRGNGRQMADATKASMDRHVRGLIRSANGTTIGTGRGGAAHASLFFTLPVGGNVRMVRAGQYHSGGVETGATISMDGIDDDLELSLAGQMSVHDLATQQQFDARAADDHFGIKFDGRLAASGPSGPAMSHTLTLPYGTKSVQYVRLNSRGGEVGGVSGYPAGRDFTLQWPTAKAQ